VTIAHFRARVVRQAQASCPEATSATDRRPTGGERAATRQHQPTRNDTKRQGQRRSRRIAAGQEMAMLAFTAMILSVAAARV
jgi:hypothetical protein